MLLCALLSGVLSSPGVLSFSELSFITEPSDVTVLPKDPAVLDCQAHGQPPVTIKWLKNGVRLAESEHTQLLPNGSLYIPKTKHTEEESDEGFYQCLSQNRYGAILSQRSHLTIAREYEIWAAVQPGEHASSSGSWVITLKMGSRCQNQGWLFYFLASFGAFGGCRRLAVAVLFSTAHNRSINLIVRVSCPSKKVRNKLFMPVGGHCLWS